MIFRGLLSKRFFSMIVFALERRPKHHLLVVHPNGNPRKLIQSQPEQNPKEIEQTHSGHLGPYWQVSTEAKDCLSDIG